MFNNSPFNSVVESIANGVMPLVSRNLRELIRIDYRGPHCLEVYNGCLYIAAQSWGSPGITHTMKKYLTDGTFVTEWDLPNNNGTEYLTMDSTGLYTATNPAIVTKYSFDGEVIWQEDLGGYEYANGMAQNSTSILVSVGNTFYVFEKTTGEYNSYDIGNLYNITANDTFAYAVQNTSIIKIDLATQETTILPYTVQYSQSVISLSGNYLFYTDNNRTLHRINLLTNEDYDYPPQPNYSTFYFSRIVGNTFYAVGYEGDVETGTLQNPNPGDHFEDAKLLVIAYTNSNEYHRIVVPKYDPTSPRKWWDVEYYSVAEDSSGLYVLTDADNRLQNEDSQSYTTIERIQ